MEHLSTEEINQFIQDGYVRIENAFTTKLAERCRSILLKASGCDPNNSQTWKQPVIRIAESVHQEFRSVVNTPILHTVFDQLAGKNRWLQAETPGSFVIRFPCKQPANDTGWHVDASFPEKGNGGDYMNWRINVNSKGRALLMLFLFSDVGERDAPTRIKRGSHFEVAKILYPEGEIGLSFMELAQRLDQLPLTEEIVATGKAGTVYLCHPFLVHAAQNHFGTSPKFMAQPPLLTKTDFNIYQNEKDLVPVERAIKEGIKK